MNKTIQRIECTKCHTNAPGNSNFCPECGSEFEKKESRIKKIAHGYDSPYGAWRVTTNGDEEGRTTIHLGDFEGNLDEIAKGLANKACYSLNFTWLGEYLEIPKPAGRSSVHCSLNIDSKTWDLPRDVRAKVMEEVLKDRPVSVSESNYYASFVINFDDVGE